MNEEKKFRILSIDGGGLRGIIPGQILVALEVELKKQFSNPDARIADYFDLIAGTSTGGILTCAYLLPDKNTNRPKLSAEQVVELYLERGDEIFSIPLMHKIRTAGGLLDEKYPADELEEALKDYFGDTELKDLLKPCLITAYDIKRRNGQFFNKTDAELDQSWNFYVRDIARATSAAPTYFECAKIKSFGNITYPLIDGGVFVNNPAMCAYAEVHNKYQFSLTGDIVNKPKGTQAITAKDMAILSIGTGYAKKEYDYKSAKDWGLVEWVKPLLDIMMSGVADVVDYQLEKMFNAVNCQKQYLRINGELPRDVNHDMDDASTENLKALEDYGNFLALQFKSQLSDFMKNYL
jgi:patatin-like phospholipase/acyl hydrolase